MSRFEYTKTHLENDHIDLIQYLSKNLSYNTSVDPMSLQLKIISAQPGVVNMELDIEKMHTNRLEILHGGVIASMTDLGGSLAVASKGLYSTGVSTDINSMSLLSSCRAMNWYIVGTPLNGRSSYAWD